MKKIHSFFVLLFLVASSQTFAQANSNEALVPVTLGKITQVHTGKAGPIYTTSSELLANTTFVTSQRNCKIEGFAFAILPKGEDLLGPYTATGAELTDNMKGIIKAHTGRIFFENITLTCDGKPKTAVPILMTYDQ